MFRWLALIYFLQLNLANFLMNLPKNYSQTINTRNLKKKSFRIMLANLINDAKYFQKILGKRDPNSQAKSQEEN